jgi:hypothetical protein
MGVSSGSHLVAVAIAADPGREHTELRWLGLEDGLRAFLPTAVQGRGGLAARLGTCNAEPWSPDANLARKGREGGDDPVGGSTGFATTLAT